MNRNTGFFVKDFVKLAAAAITALALTLPAISAHGAPPPHAKAKVHEHGGPPPHAPAHGFRRQHESGHDLVYDATLGAYVVEDLDDHYYIGDRFYRWGDGRWHVSPQLGEEWIPGEPSELPPELMERYGSAEQHGLAKREGPKPGKGPKKDKRK